MTLDIAIVVGSFCQTGDCEKCFRRDHPHHAQIKEIKSWLKVEYCILPQAQAVFVCEMEDVLEISSIQMIQTDRSCEWMKPVDVALRYARSQSCSIRSAAVSGLRIHARRCERHA
jgi:hypothetical protein